MADILTGLIPVGIGVWILFFILPAVISLFAQLFLCRLAVKLIFKLIPIVLALVLVVLVVLCAATGFLSFLIGGFVSLLLIGTALFIAGASIIGWVIYGIFRMFA